MAVDRDAPERCVDALCAVTGDAALLSGDDILACGLRDPAAAGRELVVAAHATSRAAADDLSLERRGSKEGVRARHERRGMYQKQPSTRRRRP